MPYCVVCRGFGRDMDEPIGSKERKQCSRCLGTGFIPDPQIEALIMTFREVEDGLKGIEDRLAELRDVERRKA